MNKRRAVILGAIGVLLLIAGFGFTRRLVDFPVYWAAGQSLLAGRTDLYAPDFALGPVMDYRYPPFFLVALAPLWMLPFKVSAYIWYLFSVAEISLCVVMLGRLMGERGEVPKRVWIITGLATAQYFVMMLHYGNAHLLAVALMIGALYFAAGGKNWQPALLMALSITIKLTPVFLLPYFAIRRRWRMLLMTAGFIVVLNLAPAAWFGTGKNIELLRTWYGHVIVSQEFHEINGPINLSLKGELRRLLTHVDYSQRVDGDTRYPEVNVAALDVKVADWIWKAAAAILYAAGLVLARRRKDELLGAGLFICLMLVLGPLTSKIYFTALLWPVAALARHAYAVRGSAARAARAGLWIMAALNLVLPLLPGRELQRFLLVSGVDFLLTMLVMVLTAAALAARSEQACEQQTRVRPAATAP